MKVFTTFIFAAKNKSGVQLLFSHEKISWGFAPIFMGEITVEHPTYFRRENKSCKDLHDIKFILCSRK